MFKRVKKILIAIVLPALITAVHPVPVVWARADFCLRPASISSRDGGRVSLTLQKELRPEGIRPGFSLKEKFKQHWNTTLQKSRRASAALVMAALLASPMTSQPTRAGSIDKEERMVLAGNSLVGGILAASKAPKGKKWKAFLHGSGGGAIAGGGTIFLADELYNLPGGPWVLRGINAYGANVIDNASSDDPGRSGNPYLASLRHFRYPVYMGEVTFEGWKPTKFTVDAARSAVFLTGLLTSRGLLLEDSFKTGVPVFKYPWTKFTRPRITEGGTEVLGSVALHPDYLDLGGIREEKFSNLFGHVLQNDLILVGVGETDYGQSEWSLGKHFSFRVNLSYAATVIWIPAAADALHVWDDVIELEPRKFSEHATSHDGGHKTNTNLSFREKIAPVERRFPSRLPLSILHGSI